MRRLRSFVSKDGNNIVGTWEQTYHRREFLSIYNPLIWRQIVRSVQRRKK